MDDYSQESLKRPDTETSAGPTSEAIVSGGAAEASSGGGRGRLVLVSLVSWSVLLVSLGFAGGWLVNDRIQSSRSAPGPSVIEIPADRGDFDGVMPDIRGLGLTDAKQVLVDVGFDPNLITVTLTPWGGDPGLVISQDPVVGEKVGDGIKLHISDETKVPEVVGMDFRDAVAALRGLGVEPELVEAFDMQAATNSVLAVEPAAGESLPKTATLTVAGAGSSMYLRDLKAVSGSCSTANIQINAQDYPQSLSCGTGTASSPRTTVWLLNRRVQVISGVLGVDDEGAPDASVEVTVIGDGNVLGSFAASYAEPAEVSIPVTDVLRLEVVAVSAKSGKMALGDWLLKGTTDDINALEAGS